MKHRYLEVWQRVLLYLLVLVVCGLSSSIAQGKGGAADYAYITVRYHVVDEDARNIREAPVYYKLMIDGQSPDSIGWAPFRNIAMSGNAPTTAKHSGNPNFGGEAGRYFDDRKDHKMELWVKITKDGYRPAIKKHVRHLRSATHSVISDTIVMIRRSGQAGSSSTRDLDFTVLPGSWIERSNYPRPSWRVWEFQGGNVSGENSDGVTWYATYTIHGQIIKIRDLYYRNPDGSVKAREYGKDWHVVSIDMKKMKYYSANGGERPRKTGSPKVLLRR